MASKALNFLSLQWGFNYISRIQNENLREESFKKKVEKKLSILKVEEENGMELYRKIEKYKDGSYLNEVNKYCGAKWMYKFSKNYFSVSMDKVRSVIKTYYSKAPRINPETSQRYGAITETELQWEIMLWRTIIPFTRQSVLQNSLLDNQHILLFQLLTTINQDKENSISLQNFQTKQMLQFPLNHFHSMTQVLIF
jgi:hypothetical protein